MEGGAGDDTGVLAPWMDCVPGPTLPKHTFRPVCAWREFEPKLIAKGCVDKLAFSIEMFSSTGDHPVSHQIKCAIYHPAIRCRCDEPANLHWKLGDQSSTEPSQHSPDSLRPSTIKTPVDGGGNTETLKPPTFAAMGSVWQQN